jgi:glutaredoxin
MTRPLLDESRRSPEAASIISKFHRDTVDEVIAAVDAGGWVIVGMAQNPVVKKARKLLDKHGMEHRYLEYGSYVSDWRRRLAIKIWAGYPLFPMVFRDGVLIGGMTELARLEKKGELKG